MASAKICDNCGKAGKVVSPNFSPLGWCYLSMTTRNDKHYDGEFCSPECANETWARWLGEITSASKTEKKGWFR